MLPIASSSWKTRTSQPFGDWMQFNEMWRSLIRLCSIEIRLAGVD